jgi:uncharacterized protein YkwD
MYPCDKNQTPQNFIGEISDAPNHYFDFDSHGFLRRYPCGRSNTARTAPLPTPAQRIEAAQNRSNAEADSALAQLNTYRKAMGLSVLTANNALTVAALRHSLYRSVILAENKEAENFDVNGTPGSHFQMIPNLYFTGKTLKDRVTLEGYTANATEVSTSGSRKSSAEFIHQMIASVYHRSGVLDFQWDEAGFGVIDKEPVMVLGASRKGGWCFRRRIRSSSPLLLKTKGPTPGLNARPNGRACPSASMPRKGRCWTSASFNC